jgi:hypothetical protein
MMEMNAEGGSDDELSEGESTVASNKKSEAETKKD